MTATILITGATGTVGSALVEQLKAAGVPLRAMVRSPQKAEALGGPGVEIVRGDFDDPASLDAALQGIERVFLLSAPHPQQFTQQSNVIEAAQRAGVERVVKVSAFGASPDAPLALARDHWRTEQQLAESGLAYTVLQPNGFMQNMHNNVGTIVSQGAFYGATKEGKVAWVDARDVAAVAAAALLEDGHAGQSYVISGPEALSSAEQAAQLSAVLGRPIRYIDVPTEGLVQSMIGAGVPEFLAKDLGALNDIYAAGYAALVTDTIERVAKKQPVHFELFVRDYAEAFRAS